MARFKEGQQVVCIWHPQNNCWRDRFGNVCDGPADNEVVTVAGYFNDYEIILVEYPIEGEGYMEKCFEPLMDITEVIEILEQEPATA